MEETAFLPVNTYEHPIRTLPVSTSQRGFVIDHLTNPPFPLRFLKNLEILCTNPNRATSVPLVESIHGTVKQLRFSTISIHRADYGCGSFIATNHFFLLCCTGFEPFSFPISIGMPDFVNRLTNLETLIMDKIYVLCSGGGPMESLLWIPPVLRCVTAPIRRIGIEVVIKKHRPSRFHGLAQVDHI